MEASPQLLFEVFGKDQRYVVPFFQRPYVWKEETQWGPLWADIEESAIRVLDKVEVEPHFLGAIVLSGLATCGLEVSAKQIIDGQQRLTTMQIVLAALRDVAQARGQSEIAQPLTRQTVNDCSKKHDHERFKVWPTASDQDALRDVMMAGSARELERRRPVARGKRMAGQTLVEAYRFFHQRIDAFLLEHAAAGDLGPPLLALFETLKKHVRFVVIELQEKEDPQVIFESLNGHGEPLQPSDLIRNYVFLRAQRRDEDVPTLYRDHWRVFDEDEHGFWRETQKQGRLKRPRLDLFIQHYLQCRTGHEVNVGGLYQGFRAWWDRSQGKRSVAEMLAEMGAFAEAFRRWLLPAAQTRLDELATWLRDLESSTVYPLLLYLTVEEADRLSGAELDGVLQDLESFLVRRAVCGLTAKNYNRYFLDLTRRLRAAGAPSRAALRRLLVAGTGDSVRWPGDEEFGRAWLHAATYRRLAASATAHILRATEAWLRTAKQEQLAPGAAISIEHVMPQAWRTHWSAPAGEAGPDRRDRVIHTLGNLTLVTMSLNAEASNAAFAVKREKIGQSLLMLNKEIAAASSWDEEAILARGFQLLEVARSLWPHPTRAEALYDKICDEQCWIDWEQAAEPAPLPPTISVDRARELLDAFAPVQAAAAPETRFLQLLDAFALIKSQTTRSATNAIRDLD